jgi:hypothetical protein
MHNNPAVQIEQATVLLTVDQIVEAVRQLDTAGRQEVLSALQQTAAREPNARYLSMAALNSAAAAAVWDNPADAANYDNIPWEPGDAVPTR